jgi:hypothetical protein
MPGLMRSRSRKRAPSATTKRLLFCEHKDPDFVHVWREDFDERMLLRDVHDAAAARPEAIAPVPAAACTTKAPATAAARHHEAAKSAFKYSWAQIGAVAGLAICAADLLLAWRGEKFAAWDTIAGLGNNFDHACGTVVLTAFIGFIAGAIRDAVSGQKGNAPRKNARRKTPAKNAPLFANVNIANINLMARHWRGELPLWFSCWVFGVIGSLIIPFIPAVAVTLFKAERSYSPSSIFSVSAAVWIAVFAIAVWQTVGVWRCAVRYAAAHPAQPDDQTGDSELAPLWSGLARLVVIVGFASLLATFGTEWLPQLRELYKIAFYDDPDIPPYSIRISKDGAEVEITGGFKYGLTDEFAALTKNARHLRLVHLDSAGGRLGEAEKLFTLIRERGLSTYVSSRCFSACTLAFAGGRERVLKWGATLGFHKAEFPGVSENEFDDLQHKVFKAAGFDSRFIERALSTPHKDLWTPSPDVLLAAGVITGFAEGTRTGRLPQESATSSRHVASK